MTWQNILKRSILNNQFYIFKEYLQYDAEPPFIDYENIKAKEGDTLGNRFTIKVRKPLTKKIEVQERKPYPESVAEAIGRKDYYYEEGKLYINNIEIADYFIEGGDEGINMSKTLSDSDIQKVFNYFVNNISESDLNQYKKYLPEAFEEAQNMSQSQDFWSRAFRN